MSRKRILLLQRLSCLASAGPADWHPAKNLEEEQQLATPGSVMNCKGDCSLRAGNHQDCETLSWGLFWTWITSSVGSFRLCWCQAMLGFSICTSIQYLHHLSFVCPAILHPSHWLCEKSSPFPLKIPRDDGGTSKLLRGKASTFTFAFGVGTFTFPSSEPARCLPTSAQGLHLMQPGFCWSFCKHRTEGASLYLKGDTEVKVSCGTQCHTACSFLPVYVWLRQLFWGLSFLLCSWTGKEQKEQLFELEPPKLVSDVELQSRRSRILCGSGYERYCGAQGRKQKGTLCSVQVFEQSWDITPWSASRGGAWLPWLLPWRCKKVTEQSKRQVRKKWAKAERNSKIYHIGTVSAFFFFPPELGGNEEADQNVPFKK